MGHLLAEMLESNPSIRLCSGVRGRRRRGRGLRCKRKSGRPDRCGSGLSGSGGNVTAPQQRPRLRRAAGSWVSKPHRLPPKPHRLRSPLTKKSKNVVFIVKLFNTLRCMPMWQRVMGLTSEAGERRRRRMIMMMMMMMMMMIISASGTRQCVVRSWVT